MKELNLLELKASETNNASIRDVIEDFIINNGAPYKFIVGTSNLVNEKVKDIVHNILKKYNYEFYSLIDSPHLILVDI